MNLGASLAGAAAATALLIGPARAACAIDNFAQLPVTMESLKPTVPARINGSDVRFILDSGAFYSMISRATAAHLHLALQALAPGTLILGVGGAETPSLTTVKRFTLAGADLPGVQFIVAAGGGIGDSAGLMGQNVLGLGDVEYDLANGVVRLMRPRDCGEKVLAYWVKPHQGFGQMSIEANRTRTIGTVMINDRQVKVLFDTGSPLSILTLATARRIGLTGKTNPMTPAGFTGGIGRRPVQTWIAPVESLEIGGEKVLHTKVRVGDMAPMDIDMLLGADFFLSHRIYVSNGQRKLYFTYNGGPVFNLEARTEEPASTPSTSGPSAAPATQETANIGARGAARLARHDFAGAIADLSAAIAAHPTQADLFHQRALAYLGANMPALAMPDLDQALKLDPGDAAVRILRAQMRLASHDEAGAKADLDAVDQAEAKDADRRLQLAQLYDRIEAPASAIAQYTLWLDSHPADSRTLVALNGRCWARALTGVELKAALADCNRALKISPDNPAMLDSRGLARLRLEDWEGAIADYDRALALRPKIAWSLYGRGLARLKKGLTADGRVDLAAAAAIDPKLPALAAKYGLAPP